MQLDAFDGSFPATGHTVNPLLGYGPQVTPMPPDNLSPKDSGLFAMAGTLYMTVGRQLNQGCCGERYVNGNPFYQHHGEMMLSRDYGQSWNNWQTPNTFSSSGALTTTAMFGTSPSEFSTAAFVMYGGDDGTLGYLQAINRHDNGDAYVYLVANENCWNNCSHYYLARVPRAKIQNLNAADYQYFVGGDGNLASSWSSTEAGATPIVTATNQLSEPNVQYVAALNRYVLLGYYYVNFGTNSAHTVWPVWEAPHPWGPWTQVSATDFNGPGWYNPIILNSSIWTGTTPYIMFTGDFAGPNYSMYYSTMTINH